MKTMSAKGVETMVKEYVRSLSDENLRYLLTRFSQNLCGDRADATQFIQYDQEMDSWLSSAAGPTEFFEMIDSVGDFVRRELVRRGGKLEEV